MEEQYHEAAGTSYTDAQASGFEIVPDDIVVKSFLHLTEPVEPFDFKPFPVREQLAVVDQISLTHTHLSLLVDEWVGRWVGG